MKPYVKNNKTNVVCKAEIRRLCEYDIDELVRVQDEVANALEDRAVYAVNSREDFELTLKRGEIYGLFAGGELCGTASLFFPEDPEKGLARDAEICAEQLCRCCNINAVFVAPDYRGNGIARELVRICVKRATEKYGASYVLATVSPKNIPGLLSFMGISGFRIRALKQKYSCKLRYILCYEHCSKRLFTVYERFAAENIFGISKMLADGYEGIATFKCEEGIFIWLAK